jgi:hypothetical protein
MASVPPEEHIHFSKMDLADGYWRMVVEPDARWNFAYVMPSADGQPIRLVIPRALQMGWNESPAYFCATMETARDVAQCWIDSDARLAEHPMESFTTPTKPVKRQSTTEPCRQMSAVLMISAWRQLKMPGGPYYSALPGQRYMLFIACSLPQQPRGRQMPKILYQKRNSPKGTLGGILLRRY